MKSTNRSVSFRISQEALERVDQTADLLGVSRSSYLQTVVEEMHGEEFNPVNFAKKLLENKAAQIG